MLSEQTGPIAGEALGVSSVTGTAGLLSRQLSQRLSQNYDAAEVPASQDTMQIDQDQENKEQRKQQLEHCLGKQFASTPDKVRPIDSRSKPSWSDTLLSTLQEHHAVFKAPVVKRAFSVAVATSSFQAQLDFNAKTAVILAHLRLDADTVAATLLYGVLEATPITQQQLAQLLPSDVSKLLVAASRIDYTCALLRTDHAVKEVHTAAQLTTMLLEMADVRAVLMVLANKLQHMRSGAAAAASGSTDLRVEAAEGLRVFAPLANRLGVWKLKAELEDLCFMVLQPLKAQELQSSLAKPQSLAGLNDALTILKNRLDSDGVAYKDLTGRPKNLYGVHQKLRRKGFFAEVSDIHDVRGLRLIMDSKQDCWAALRAVESLWQPLPRRFKDYIRNPKANGYQSLHTVVLASDGLPLEVQIRTAKMHYIAEYGVAAHWRYKEVLGDESGHTDRLVGWSRWLITWHMELEDGKCRPQGSPPRDTSLSALFPAPFLPATRAAACTAGICAFPQHASDCRFSDFVQSDHFAPRSAATDGSAPPIYVLLLGLAAQGALTACGSGNTGGAAMGLSRDSPASLDLPAVAPPSIRQLPAGTTVGDLVSGTIAGVGAMYTPADVAAGSLQPQLQVSVNRQLADDMSLLLASGDEVELVRAEIPLTSWNSRPPVVPIAVSTGAEVPVMNVGSTLSTPQPTFTAPAGNILPTGGLGKRLATSRSAVKAAAAQTQHVVAASHLQQSYGSPSNETATERGARIGRSRQAISRAYVGPPAANLTGLHGNCSSWDEVDSEPLPRTPSDRVEAITAQRCYVPPHMRSSCSAVPS